MSFIAIFAPQIANDKPLYAVYKGQTIFPALADLPFGSGEGKYIINPDDSAELLPNSKLFVLGKPSQIQDLKSNLNIS